MARVRVHLIDPSGDVIPYDHALAGALARRGLDVELVTSRFVHGPAPVPLGYSVSESFYRLATRLGERAPRRRRAVKLAEHVPDMLRYRRRAAAADVRHFQWLPIERIDAHLLPAERPRVLTMHNVIRREAVDLRLARRMDAVIVHTRHGAELLGEADNVHVIPHGAFEHLTQLEDERPLPAELAEVERPVVLYFGVVRPYKGVDVLVEAFQQVEDAELWVVGRPLGVSMERLRRLAPPGRVRFVERYVPDAELPALFRRADVVALPHRNVDVSGVLAAGLAFGKAMVMSDVGGFRELVEDHGAGLLVPPGDSDALAAAHRRPARRPRGAPAARGAGARRGGGPLLVGPHRRADRRRLRAGAGVRAIFMAKCKRSAARALDWLVAEGVDVAAVVASEPDRFTREQQRVDLVAERHGLRVVSDEELYAEPPEDVDVVISFLFWKLIREPLVSLGRIGCLNFHPAPLPDMRGLGGYNVAILEGMREWGVSCHFVDESFDTGDLVEVERFPIDPDAATAFSLDLESQERLFGLFQRVMGTAIAGDELPRTPQGPGRYVDARRVRAAAPRAARGRPRSQAARLLVSAPPGGGGRGGGPRADSGGRAAACRGGRGLPRLRARALGSTP